MYSRIQGQIADSKEVGRREVFRPDATQSFSRHHAASPTLPDSSILHNAIKATNQKFHVKSLQMQNSIDRGNRRQKQSGSLMVPPDRINKYLPFQQLNL